MKTKGNKTKNPDEMLAEYDFDYSQGKPNKFVQEFHHSTIKVYDKDEVIKEMKPVLVETDIIRHFRTSKRINKALRSLIHAQS